MADIKTKQKVLDKIQIKNIDKRKLYSKKLKDNLVEIKQHNNFKTEDNEENSANQYGINKLKENTSRTINRGKNTFKKYGKKSTLETKKNIQFVTKKIKQKIENRTIKNNLNDFKLTGKVANKITKQTVKSSIKGTKKAYQIAKTMAKVSINGIKATTKATVSTIKGLIAGTKALLMALIAGGWVAVIIVVVICVIALVCSSIFGIFFSSEKDVGDKTMNAVIQEINTDFTNKITDIQKNNEHDEYEIKSNRAEWKDILCVYAVVVSNGDEATNVVTLDDKKISKLKEIFWKMNIVSSKVIEQEKEIKTTDEDGNIKIQKVTRKVLYIDIENKSVEEMIQEYNFNEQQLEQLAELQKDEYNSMWSNVLYGTSTGNNNIVAVALSQVGNVGGQPYWSWYGYEYRVEWCACFISWCANECGYIDAGALPKFASCETEGVSWFKTCGLWKERGYIPKAGDIIFFDWADSNDGKADHVGIVEKCENGRVYTIEGNSTGDTCRQKDYDINSSVILGYGTPMY